MRYAAPKFRANADSLRLQKKAAARSESAHSASTAVLEQEAEEAAGCAGPGECECPSCRLSAATGLGPFRTPQDGAQPQPYGVIVDDDHDLADGQIHKTDFLDQTSAATEQAVDEVLRPTGQTARDCPYLAYWLNFYRNASAARIERVIQKYANPTQIDPDGLRTAVIERVTLSAQRYVETQGADMALPPGIDATTTSDGVGEPTPQPQAVQAYAEGSGSGRATSPAALQASLGTGRPIEPSTRARMERSFGQSFAGVQLHTDRHASRLSRSMAARAFTVGSHVAFAEQEYRPGTLTGDLLLAHELAHVVQQSNARGEIQPLQDSSPETVLEQDADLAAAGAVASLYFNSDALKDLKTRRSSPLALRRCKCPKPIATTTADFAITGKKIAPADLESLYFERNSDALTAPDDAKIAQIITANGAASTLTLFGYASEDETAGLGMLRANKVDSSLAAAAPPHTGTRTPLDKSADVVGKLDYRQNRRVAVEVPPVGVPVAPPPAAACGHGPPAAVACGTSFTTAHPVAAGWLTSAVAALSAAPLAANTTALLTQLFGGVGSLATIQGKVAALRAHVAAMPAQHQCHNDCDAGCSRPAYNCGLGIGVPAADPCNTRGSAAMMTFCPDFVKAADVNYRAHTILHEGSHGTAGIGAQDIAYQSQRGIITLTPAQALQNTDSYVLLIRNLHAPGSAHIGPAVPDTVGGANCPGSDLELCRAIAFSAKWFEISEWDVSLAYGTVVASLSAGAPWPDADKREIVHRIAPWFGLTDPGTWGAGTPPTNDDKIKLAGIHDRYITLRNLSAKPVTATKAAPAESWVDGTPNTALSVGAGYAAQADDLARTRFIALLLVSSTASIDPRLRNSFIEGADQIRQKDGLGP
jgi:hypothetical protein